jgi:hypothetical protein
MNTTDNTPAPDYGEPWKLYEPPYRIWRDALDRHGNIVFDDGSDSGRGDPYCSKETAVRIIACVNACAGLPNPAAHLAAMREAIREAHDALAELVALGSLELPHRRDNALNAGQSALTKLQPYLDQ